MLRLFFALQPAAEQGAELLERTAPLAAQLHAHLVPATNLHATLCFVGAVAPEKLDAVKTAAAAVRGRVIELKFDALDYWAEPRVVCATAPERHDAARELSRALTTAMVCAGFAPDHKPFRPHLTLARKVRVADAMRFEWPRALTPSLAVRCDRFVLMESRREESGSIYSVLDSWALDADKPLRKPSE